jgi:uncharacterized caspase-like protein
MRIIMKRRVLCSVFIFLFLAFGANAATERRTALVIGNSSYRFDRLQNPVNDANDMGTTLKNLGFNVILKKDVGRREMIEAVNEFGQKLKDGNVGLFYYAGHAVQIDGVNYLIPIGAQVNDVADVEHEAVDLGRILSKMSSAGNAMNIVILDACRNNPFRSVSRTIIRGLAVIPKPPSGTIISYSTSPGDVAKDGSGRNSPYTSALIEYIQEPGLPITDMFMKVRQKLRREVGQVPWEVSSLDEKFYFRPQGNQYNTLSDSPAYTPRPDPDEIAQQKAALEQERQELARQKALDAEQLAAERRKVEAERQQLAKVQRPSVSTAGEAGRDGRFIAYNNGTVLDTKTSLMWAAKDNGSNINKSKAKSYCENYRGGGYADWRMPTQDELAGLYDAGKTYKSDCGYDVHLTELIRLTCSWAWIPETRDHAVLVFRFDLGKRSLVPALSTNPRALPVRSAK